MSLPASIAALDELTGRYRAILCDVWGVVHNGVEIYPAAIAALARARQRGLAVILITNAPRPHGSVEAQLDQLGVATEAYDRVVTSGDVTRDLIAEGPRDVFHIGSDRELTIYDGLDVSVAEESEARVVVCTGLYNDEVETPDDYAELLHRLRARDLPMICANPDIVVERGEKLIWCAGALARDYALLGGRTRIAGKPHRPIYQAALRAAGEVLGSELAPGQVLAIGDGIMTDVKGASDNGLEILYVSGGIHWRDYGETLDYDPPRLAAFLVKHGYKPVAVMPRLK